CREVLTLTAEQAPQTAAEVKQFPAHARPRVWMPWGAVAAGIAIACGVAVYRAERKPVYAPAVAQNEKAAPVQTHPVQSPPVQTSQVQTSQVQTPPRQEPQTPAAPPEIAAKKSNHEVDRTREKVPAETGADKLRAERKEQITVDADQIEESDANVVTPAAKPKTETQARESAAGLQAPAVAPAFSGLAGSRTPSAEARFASVVRPHWRLNEEGQPQRAFGDGAWQPALAAGPTGMHVLAIVGDTVWTGGEESQVFRSLDEGETWQEVPLPRKNGGNHTIAHIRFESATEGTIEAVDGAQWRTNDGGRTWK
ncbi:MAG: hypothetical protein WBF42_01710, partial [Terracidiphilus sp.]